MVGFLEPFHKSRSLRSFSAATRLQHYERMNQVELQLENSEEPTRLDIAAREIVQLRADLDTMLAAHRQFGQLSSNSSTYQKLLQKVTRRSLTWYTSSQHSLQGATFRLLRDIAAILVQLPDFKMYVSLDDDFIGGSIIRTREYEPHLSRVFRQHIRPGMQVLDIGANMGYFSLLAASLVGPGGRVYSWEPSSSNVRMLRASQIVNHFSNIEIVQAAAGAQTGLLHYFPNASNDTVSAIDEAKPEDLAHAETVMALRVDDLVGQNEAIGFLKIDFEGYEYEALRGAQETIRRCRPIIASEFCPSALRSASGISGEDFLQFFVQLGYDLSVIEGDRLVAGRVSDVISQYEHSGVDHIDILLRPSELKG